MNVADLRALFAYDEWANRRAFDAAAGLTPEQIGRRVPSDLPSLGDTLAHIVVVRDILMHAVNHSTYHRGQVARLLRQLGAAAPETDFVVFSEGA
jgi:uncharacterized damage-inducible protein DinB